MKNLFPNFARLILNVFQKEADLIKSKHGDKEHASSVGKYV